MYANFDFDTIPGNCVGGGGNITGMVISKRKILVHVHDRIISVENLLAAWREFKNGKRKKEDVGMFERNLMDNIFQLHRELSDGRYCHAGYAAFKISDPKPRDIHKALVRDRLVHHAIYNQVYWFFDRKFIYDSYSCRKYKGTHKALDQFTSYCRKVSKNNTKTCWILKCDIKKFFASIDHEILKTLLRKHIHDQETVVLLENIIESFKRVGLPLGNLTSQILVNIYMNEFDQFVKHSLKQKYYIRYADDFVFLSQNKSELEQLIPKISDFLDHYLKLQLHPNKLFLKTLASGVDFLGWVHFPKHRVLRTATKRRMMKKAMQTENEAVIQSYLGLLSHGNEYRLQKVLEERLRFLDKNPFPAKMSILC